MPHKKKTKKRSLKASGWKKASNKTTQFTYYYNKRTNKVFKDTNKDGKIR